ncbi:MAG: hypothetical protein K6A94_11990 [Bacteroidales bacterium]|nr:hypothetical protein [Bacteroidales bacterium]
MGIPKYELNQRPLQVAADQEFDPNSTNAQSGVAVNAAINAALQTISHVEEITYSELVTLRNGGNLVPGMWYRIINYTCTTTQANTQAANNRFDIIVRADSATTLNEDAYAAHHAGDTYFQNCKLENWLLKYCLDNDTDRFVWADDQDGRGVVYYMKDEWGNECPYDFKNIMFQRWAVTADQDHPYLVVDNADNSYGYYYGAKDLQDNNVLSKATYGEDTGYFYTFALKDLESGEWFDYTVVAHLGLKNDEGNEIACYDNHLTEATDEYASGKGEMAKMLNNIVFFNCYTDLSDTQYADDYSYCNNNRFLGNCHSNTFGNNCGSNTFGNNCGSNTFGNNNYQNTFGNNNYQNTFGNDFRYNSFGNGCNSNSFGNYCYQNTFGNGFQYNSFGNYCYNNSFGNNCGINTFGNSCYSNSFGNNCGSNTFGNYCYSNSFGNDCGSNSFGNYCRYITVFDGVQYCTVTGGSSQNAQVQNAQILNGTAGTNANRLTIGFTANVSYTQVAAKNTAGNLRIWNPADLVQ